jgi:hypothetical protein
MTLVDVRHLALVSLMAAAAIEFATTGSWAYAVALGLGTLWLQWVRRDMYQRGFHEGAPFERIRVSVAKEAKRQRESERRHTKRLPEKGAPVPPHRRIH